MQVCAIGCYQNEHLLRERKRVALVFIHKSKKIKNVNMKAIPIPVKYYSQSNAWRDFLR